MTSDESNQNPKRPPGNRSTSNVWLIILIIALLVLDYATILRIEIFSEMQNGKSFTEALKHGNMVITLAGILVSIVGVAWILYLVAGRKDANTSV